MHYVVGFFVGEPVGLSVGLTVGLNVGLNVGASVGLSVLRERKRRTRFRRRGTCAICKLQSWSTYGLREGDNVGKIDGERVLMDREGL